MSQSTASRQSSRCICHVPKYPRLPLIFWCVRRGWSLGTRLPVEHLAEQSNDEELQPAVKLTQPAAAFVDLTHVKQALVDEAITESLNIVPAPSDSSSSMSKFISIYHE